uniref:ATP synthase F0 subunit 8 n=1 Tax=Calliopsida cinnabarina TaxID=2219944 RepID=A0A3Q8GQX8_9HEMI|nr:ATP synthase F0 subunit 8 [Calliopsida cinnabarina]
MPQMSPMYWLMLFLYFILFMFFLMTFIYFTYFNICKKSNVSLMNYQLNWLW